MLIMDDLQVGDKVSYQSKVAAGSKIKFGEIGTVRVVEDGQVGVVFDRNIGGHSLDGRCANGYGWYFYRDTGPKVSSLIRVAEESDSTFDESEEMNEFMNFIKCNLAGIK